MAENLHPDQNLLEIAATWHVARLRAMLCWAESDKASLFGIRGDSLGSPSADLDIMRGAVDALAPGNPKTICGARELIRVALKILEERERDPDTVLADGPALPILRGVIAALDYRPDLLLREDEAA